MSSDEDSMHLSREKFTVERSPSEPQAAEDPFDFFGPVLPPHLLKKEDTETKHEKKIYGPTLPDNISLKNEEKPPTEIEGLVEEKEQMIGPEIPGHLKLSQSEMEVKEEASEAEAEDEDNFGPSTVLMTTGDLPTCYTSIGLRNPKKESTGDSNPKRESWMTELPSKKGTNFGLMARHFKTKVLSDKESDSSVWTDTPSERNNEGNKTKKKDHKEELRMKRLEERDKEMEKLVKKATKKLRKKESLLEIHLKNLKKKKKKEDKKNKDVPERRPFDRNVDLQVRRIDESQKRAILNKSLNLNDRFSSGQSKFL